MSEKTKHDANIAVAIKNSPQSTYPLLANNDHEMCTSWVKAYGIVLYAATFFLFCLLIHNLRGVPLQSQQPLLLPSAPAGNGG